MSVRRLIILCVGLLAVLSAAALPAGAEPPNEVVAEAEFLRLINEHRSRLNLAPLAPYWDLVDDARSHSLFQSEDRCGGGERICHNSELAEVTTGWYALGENVGVGYDVASLDRAFWESPDHQHNVVGNYNYAGVGVVVRPDGTMYVTVLFMRGPDGLPAEEPPPGRDYAFPIGADKPGVHQVGRGAWVLHGSDRSFYYGLPDDVPLTCDWDGSGGATVGLYRSATGYLYLRNDNGFGDADLDSFYGIPDDVPLCGDWDGDGVETIAVYRPAESMFYLHNSNMVGLADAEVRLGTPGDIPLVGDWFGRGYDSVAVYRPTTATLLVGDGRMGAGNVVALPGPSLLAGDELIAGDWNADGSDSPGIYRPDTGEFWLHLGLEPDAEVVSLMVAPDGLPVVGNW